MFGNFGKIMILLAAFGFGLMPIESRAGLQKEMGGWGIDSPYNKHYDVRELEKFRAWVVDIKETKPMPDMSPGVVLLVRESKDPDDELIEVHVCPSWFIKPGNIGLARGDRIKIRGVWAEINGKDVFMAAKIKKGDFFSLKVRLTKDGTPFWTMSPEQLALERKAAKD